MDLLPPRDRGFDDAAADRLPNYVSQAKAANTLRAYAADWRHFADWSRDRDRYRPTLPAFPAAVCLHLTELADSARLSTLTRASPPFPMPTNSPASPRPAAIRPCAPS